MEDLDLDELDSAVTQLMDKPKGKPAVKKPVPPKPEVAKVAAEPPAPDAPVSITVTQKTPRVALAKPAPRKRMGLGTMDIVQRSVAASPRRPNREGSALQPTKSVTPQLVQPTPRMSAPESTPQTKDVSDDLLASLNMLEDSNKTVKPRIEVPAPAFEAEAWPDPIDLHDFDDKKEASHVPAPEPTPAEPAEEPPTLQSAPTPAEEPAASPFVTTKVEKRPLGAYANTPAPEPEKPADIPVPPEETTKADMAQTALQSSHHVDSPDDEADMDDLRQMSIPQQYHTAQTKPHEAVHNIFDTREYHAPPHPMRTEHRGSPWLAISIVVLIVLVIGVAAVGYLMMTGMLDISKIW